MPLTETINTIPPGDIELLMGSEILSLYSGDFRRDRYGFGLGILSWLSLWYSFDYLHRDVIRTKEDGLGDSFFKIWTYINDFFGDRLHLGLLTSFRVPTGRNVYEERDWQGICYGNNELKIGPVIQLDTGRIYWHFNLFYIFREGNRQGFYNLLYFDPMEKTTYTKLLGLNFASDDTFMESERLKNDYALFSAAVNTDFIYPFVPFIGLYYSGRLYRGDIRDENIPIEGASLEILLFNAGIRYFLLRSVHIGIYFIYNPKRQQDFIKEILGFEINALF